jgi:hypothetical protein
MSAKTYIGVASRVITEQNGGVGTIYVVEPGSETRPLQTADLATEFGWGYEGGGPRETVAALLRDVLGEMPRFRLYQDYTDSVIAELPPEGWRLAEAEVRAWLVARPPVDDDGQPG